MTAINLRIIVQIAAVVIAFLLPPNNELETEELPAFSKEQVVNASDVAEKKKTDLFLYDSHEIANIANHHPSKEIFPICREYIYFVG